MLRNLTVTQFCLSALIQHNRISQLKISIDIFLLPRIFIRRDLTCCCVKRQNERKYLCAATGDYLPYIYLGVGPCSGPAPYAVFPLLPSLTVDLCH